MFDNDDPAYRQILFNSAAAAGYRLREQAAARAKGSADRRVLEAVLLLAFRQAAAQTPELFSTVDLPKLAAVVAAMILRGEV